MSYRKTLGDWGEAHALRLLKAAAFTDIKPLNIGLQHPGGDLLARRKGGDYPMLTVAYAHLKTYEARRQRENKA